MSRTHLVIPDTQVTPDTTNEHIIAIGNLIVACKPDVIVHLGDHWDMESLSSYASSKELEGRRYADDIDAGNESMHIINDAIDSIAGYKPERYFCLGNHEHRISRAIAKNPTELDGVIGYCDFTALEDWNVYDFLELAEVDGVNYTHFIANPMTGKPQGGSIEAILNKTGFSFTTGHRQTLQYGVKYQNDGQNFQGIIAGSCYLHDEGYKGHQGNYHWRGIVWKNNVEGGAYDPTFMHIDQLMEKYG